MTNKLKKIVALLFCVMVVFSSFSVCICANAKNEPIEYNILLKDVSKDEIGFFEKLSRYFRNFMVLFTNGTFEVTDIKVTNAENGTKKLEVKPGADIKELINVSVSPTFVSRDKNYTYKWYRADVNTFGFGTTNPLGQAKCAYVSSGSSKDASIKVPKVADNNYNYFFVVTSDDGAFRDYISVSVTE